MSDATKIKGMGAIPHSDGVAFRVWAPHAEMVSVIGSFNGWDSDKHPMGAEENGNWYANVAEAHVGDQYKFMLTSSAGVQAHRPVCPRGDRLGRQRYRP